MANYRKILLALDLTSNFDELISRACQFAHSQSASLTILNVVEFLAVDPNSELALCSPRVLEEELVSVARKRIEAALRCGESSTDTGTDVSICVQSGNTLDSILQAAEDDDIDLIIVGRQQRHGLALLLGRTEDAVLHHARCDVLAMTL